MNGAVEILFNLKGGCDENVKAPIKKVILPKWKFRLE